MTMLIINSYSLCCSMINLTEEQQSSDESNRDEMAVAQTREFVHPAYPDFLPLLNLFVTCKVESENTNRIWCGCV